MPVDVSTSVAWLYYGEDLARRVFDRR